MNTQLVVHGTIGPDGTLELDQNLPLPPGRVQVIVQPLVQPPPNDPFWKMMEQIWAGQKVRGHMPRSVEEVEAERRAMRQESEAEIQEAMRAREEGQRARERLPESQDGSG